MRILKPGTKVVPFQKTIGCPFEEITRHEEYTGCMYVSSSETEGNYLLSTSHFNAKCSAVFKREDFKLYREKKPLEIKKGVWYRLKPIKQLLKEGLIYDCGDGYFCSVSKEKEIQIGIIPVGITPTMAKNWNKPIIVSSCEGAEIFAMQIGEMPLKWMYLKEWLQKISIIN